MSSKTDGEVSPTLKVKNHIELIDFNAVTAMIAFSKIISFYQKKYIECDKIYLILGLTGLLHSLFCYKWPVDIFTILSNCLSLSSYFSFKVQQDVAGLLQPYFAPDNLVAKCLEYAATQEHIMDFTRLRALGSLFSMLNQG